MKSVIVDGPAHRVKVGDVITEIDGQAVDGARWDGDDSLRLIETRAVGTAAKLKIDRDDKEQAIDIKIDAARCAN